VKKKAQKNRVSADKSDADKLSALREAARLGIEDIEAGRYREFSNAEDFGAYLIATTEGIVRPRR
jgi:transposase